MEKEKWAKLLQQNGTEEELNLKRDGSVKNGSNSCKLFPNLVPFNQMPEDKHKQLSSKGGKASGISRRAKRERINSIKEEKIAEEEKLSDEVHSMRQLAHQLCEFLVETKKMEAENEQLREQLRFYQENYR